MKFRPYNKGDADYITIQGKEAGCWSFVGRRGGGQVVNFQNPGCVHHGIVIHELLHALGFYHQQSSHERDEYVKINWGNIKLGITFNLCILLAIWIRHFVGVFSLFIIIIVILIILPH